ncbi:MAG: CoA transferase [SAR202 cluster bacterium]|nr:CoA transferase [SAR202 cluster bacterium]|tara:strand:+ start:1913 stop:3133 length:1221 start_codon:yes stop_codon:yes gene_type:complete
MEGNMAGPLEGVKIIDFTHWLAGPFGTMILCDLGAEVIHVERITATDSNRGDGPYVNGISSYRYSLERGKKSIQVDLKDPTGLQIVKDLINKADVVTENFSVGVMEKLGLGYEQFEGTNPGLIYASCSGYGQTGPRAQQGAFDVIAQGFSGLMSITGEPDGRPMRVGTSVGDTFGGTYMALGILSALYERDRSGKGQKIDVSMVESVIYNLENAIIRYSITGQIPQRIGTRHPLITPFQTFETANGYICIAGLRDWEAFCFILGLEELATDDRFNTGEKRTQNHGVLEPILTEALKKQTTQHWIEVLEGIAVSGPINNLEDMIEDPHIKARNSIVSLPVPGENEQQVKVSNTPVRLSRTPADVSKRAFVVGEHTKSILNEWLNYDDKTIIDLEEKGILKTSDNEFI